MRNCASAGSGHFGRQATKNKRASTVLPVGVGFHFGLGQSNNAGDFCKRTAGPQLRWHSTDQTTDAPSNAARRMKQSKTGGTSRQQDTGFNAAARPETAASRDGTCECLARTDKNLHGHGQAGRYQLNLLTNLLSLSLSLLQEPVAWTDRAEHKSFPLTRI